MEWIDTHVHISGVSPDGTVREHLADDVAAVLEAAGAELRFVVNCCEAVNAYEFTAHEGGSGVDASKRAGTSTTLTERLPGRVYGACMVNPYFLDESLKVMDTVLRRVGVRDAGGDGAVSACTTG